MNFTPIAVERNRTTEVGVTVTMAACGKDVSVVKKGDLWGNTSTLRRALKLAGYGGCADTRE